MSNRGGGAAEAAGGKKKLLTHIVFEIGLGVLGMAVIYLLTNSWGHAIGAGIGGAIGYVVWEKGRDPWQPSSRLTKVIDVLIIGVLVAVIGLIIVEGRTLTLVFGALLIVSLVLTLSVILVKMILSLGQMILELR
jgi:hypothetical protein